MHVAAVVMVVVVLGVGGVELSNIAGLAHRSLSESLLQTIPWAFSVYISISCTYISVFFNVCSSHIAFLSRALWFVRLKLSV